MAKAGNRSKSDSPVDNKSSNLQAGVAGAGIGTLLVSLAKNIPDNNPLKSWLVIAAPTVSVVVAWLAKKIDIYFKRRKLELLKKKIKEHIDEALKSPNLSQQERSNLQRTLIEIEMANIESLSVKIKSINIEIN